MWLFIFQMVLFWFVTLPPPSCLFASTTLHYYRIPPTQHHQYKEAGAEKDLGHVIPEAGWGRLAVLRAFSCRFHTVLPLFRHLPASMMSAIENLPVLIWLQTVICTSDVNRSVAIYCSGSTHKLRLTQP